MPVDHTGHLAMQGLNTVDGVSDRVAAGLLNHTNVSLIASTIVRQDFVLRATILAGDIVTA